ncbi:hypothetical protein GOODEAATRI_001393, partial [Goodea atripinnis]
LVRRRSKACRAGLREHDELIAIGDQMCADLTHAQAMSIIDEETSTLNLKVRRYESATDTGFTTQWHVQGLTGVPRRELIYLPHQYERNTSAHTLTPRTLTPTPDQSPVDVEGEGDSGFQETGGCTAPAFPPLVSPERAKEALKLGSGHHLVPMVGPQLTPVNDELYTTYMDKARQASEYRSNTNCFAQIKPVFTSFFSTGNLIK